MARLFVLSLLLFPALALGEPSGEVPSAIPIAGRLQFPETATPAVHTSAGATDAQSLRVEAPGSNAFPAHAPLRPVEASGEASTPQAARRYSSFKELSEWVKDDEVVAPMVLALERRQLLGAMTAVGSVGVGLMTTLAGFVIVPRTACDFVGPTQRCEYSIGNYLVMAGGLVLALVGGLSGIAMNPQANAVLRVLETWNLRHPETPFAVSGRSQPERPWQR